MYAADTIAAIATPSGTGGIGIVRVSGPLAIAIGQRVFAATGTNDWQSSHLYHGTVIGASGDTLDEALATIMRAPRSYTGEDTLELHCHGSPVGLRRVLAAVLADGARLAEPGEFTRRAFLNGRLDLAQAEAVAELIQSRTDAGAAVAAEQLLGRLSRQLEQIRDQLIDIRAALEVQIDFSEEDVPVDQQELADDIERALGSVQQLVDSYHRGQLIRDGARVAIIGKPNVGKSSLLNALLHVERAIVTAFPGTTRDVVEEAIDLGGIPVLLSDTAGLRATGDPVEAIGVERARAKLAAADVLIAVLDGSRPLDGEDTAVIDLLGGRRAVIAINKSDLPCGWDESSLLRLSAAPVRISALTGAGLDTLRDAIFRGLGAAADGQVGHGPQVGSGPMYTATVTLVRHHDALAKSAHSLQLALDGVRQRVPPELIAVDVQLAADHLGAITGMITTEDVLDRIFSEFCIGK